MKHVAHRSAQWTSEYVSVHTIPYSHAVWKIWIQDGNSRYFCTAATYIYRAYVMFSAGEVAEIGRWESNPVLEFKSNRLVPTALNSCRFNLQTNVIQEVKDNNDIRWENSQRQTIFRAINDSKYSKRKHLCCSVCNVYNCRHSNINSMLALL